LRVERKPGVAGQAVFVTGPDNPRLDVNAAGLGDDDDAEVRDGTRQAEAEDLLRPAQTWRDAQWRRVAR
jgi:hypothetical protein